jgi:hypothetical protein
LASFLQSLVKKFSGPKPPRPPQAFVAAFGKHPGWNDHIDDQGLETEELIGLKRFLYVQGIGGNIDSGAWDKLPDDEQLKEFKHLFVWRAGDEAIVGRLWSSSDGKGRKRYPMIVAMQANNVRLPWLLDKALPRLEKLEDACTSTVSAQDVCAALDNARNEFRRLVALPEAGVDTPPAEDPLLVLSKRPEMGEGHRGLLTILYQVEREMAAFRPNIKADRGSRIISIAPRQIRVPACGTAPDEVLLLWGRFLSAQLDASTPTLLILPLEATWLDIIVGEPSIRELFCIRATPRKFPLTTDIPYTLDPEFVERSTRAITAIQAP